MPATLTPSSMLGMAMRFAVEIGGFDLGSWASCKGLAVGFEYEEMHSAGNYANTTLLPKQVKYQTITLQRAMTAADSTVVQGWLTKAVETWYVRTMDPEFGNPLTMGTHAQIVLFDSKGLPVTTWHLSNVYPKGWKGPDLDASGGKVAIETLELIHEGFLHHHL